MDKRHDEYKYKRRVSVRVGFRGLKVDVFLAVGQRLVDLMNSPEPYIVTVRSGRIVITSKASIHQIEQIIEEADDG